MKASVVTPLCSVVHIDRNHHRRGLWKALMAYWKDGTKALGSALLMTSDRVDEEARYFYWKSGSEDCGTLVMEMPAHRQAIEIFFAKTVV